VRICGERILTWNFMHTSGTEWRTRIECLKL